MKYKLTLEFDTIEELQAHLAGGASEQEVPPVIPESKPRGRKKADPAPAPAPTKEEEVHVATHPSLAQPQSTAATALNRPQIIAHVQAQVAKLDAAGVKGADFGNMLGELYAQTGCPAGKKISELDDAQLTRFIPAFDQLVQLKTAPNAHLAAPAAGSFV